jgi:hypothetical protein
MFKKLVAIALLSTMVVPTSAFNIAISSAESSENVDFSSSVKSDTDDLTTAVYGYGDIDSYRNISYKNLLTYPQMKDTSYAKKTPVSLDADSEIYYVINSNDYFSDTYDTSLIDEFYAVKKIAPDLFIKANENTDTDKIIAYTESNSDYLKYEQSTDTDGTVWIDVIGTDESSEYEKSGELIEELYQQLYPEKNYERIGKYDTNISYISGFLLDFKLNQNEPEKSYDELEKYVADNNIGTLSKTKEQALEDTSAYIAVISPTEDMYKRIDDRAAILENTDVIGSTWEVLYVNSSGFDISEPYTSPAPVVTTTAPVSATTTTTTTTTIESKTVVLGDINNDNKVDSRDAVVVLKDYASQILGNKSTLDLSIADMNSDGKINSSDAVIILKQYAQSIVGK